MTSFEPEAGAGEALERSQEAIEDAKAGAGDALGDLSPTPELDAPGTGDGLEANEPDVAPRPS